MSAARYLDARLWTTRVQQRVPRQHFSPHGHVYFLPNISPGWNNQGYVWDMLRYNFFSSFFFVVHSGIIERTLVSLWEEVVHFTSQRVTSADPNTAVVSAQLYKLYKAGWDSVFLCYVIIYENHTILTDALWQSVCRDLGDRVQSCGLVVKYAYPGTHISLSAKGHLKMLEERVTTIKYLWLVPILML